MILSNVKSRIVRPVLNRLIVQNANQGIMLHQIQMVNRLVFNVVYQIVQNAKTVLGIVVPVFMATLYIFLIKHVKSLWFKTVKISWMVGVKIVIMAIKLLVNILVSENVV